MTTAEVVVSTLLVGLVLVGALNGGGSVLSIWRDAEQRHDGHALAQQLMAEILSQHYEEPTDPAAFGVESPEGPGERVLWDDVDDYEKWSSAPQDQNRNPLAGYESWTRSVRIEFSQLGDPTKKALSDEGLKKITVTVTDPGGQTTVLIAYRSKWGTLESELEAASSVQTWVSDQIEVGGQTSVYGGVQIPNHAEDRL